MDRPARPRVSRAAPNTRRHGRPRGNPRRGIARRAIGDRGGRRGVRGPRPRAAVEIQRGGCGRVSRPAGKRPALVPPAVVALILRSGHWGQPGKSGLPRAGRHRRDVAEKPAVVDDAGTPISSQLGNLRRNGRARYPAEHQIPRPVEDAFHNV